MNIWQDCLDSLERDLGESEFRIWLKPLKMEENNDLYTIYCPNQYFLSWVKSRYKDKIVDSLLLISKKSEITIDFSILDPNINKEKNVDRQQNHIEPKNKVSELKPNPEKVKNIKGEEIDKKPVIQELLGFEEALSLPQVQQNSHFGSILKKEYTFDNFIVGKANEIACAAALQSSMNPGDAHNPLFIYGGSGLGKTHLMHAIGNHVLQNNANAKILYVTSERYIKDYVDSIRLHSIDEFQNYYRSVDVLMVDDIQFIAGKAGSQEEFFHTFNSLFEQGKQVVLSCDKYPNEIPKLEERLASRFSFGLTVTIDMPDLETRTAILLQKAKQANCSISQNVALYIAHHIRSNIRELEGALKRVLNSARFNKKPIDEKLAKECLSDVISIQDKIIKIDNIQRVVADYYQIKITDLLSKLKTRNVTQPRQIAMSLAREMTHHSLPEIGTWFAGRDHTTVMHAIKNVKKLCESNSKIGEDYQILIRKLSR